MCQMTPPSAPYLTRIEAAALLGVTPNGLNNYAKTKRLLPTPETRGRGRKSLYDRDDVLRLKAETDAWKATRQRSQTLVSPAERIALENGMTPDEFRQWSGNAPPSRDYLKQHGLKRCTKCREFLPLARFAACKHVKSGLASWCRSCTNTNGAQWHQRTKDRPERQEQRKATKRAWEKANPERYAALKKRSDKRCKERIRAYLRDWYQRNSAYARAYSSAKYAASKEGKPRHLKRFLVELADCKSCPKCRRLRSLLQFDRDGRTVDGYSQLCLECLPPRKSPPGGYLYELDRPRSDTPNAAWQECGQRAKTDPPEDIYVVICSECNQEGTTKNGNPKRGIVGRHKRFYHQLGTDAPIPGTMHLCVGCAWRDGTHCSHPDKKPNGGEGLLVEFPKPTVQHFTCTPRSMNGYYHFYKPATRCAGREEEYCEEVDLDGLDDPVWESSKESEESQ